jgi:methyl-accepting chemotaxis protein
MGALSRAGLTFDASQKTMIKTMAESGDLLGAQKIILGELEAQLGGTAAASADASDKIANAFGEMIESGGTILLPYLDEISDALLRLSGSASSGQVALNRVSAEMGVDSDSAEAFAFAVRTIRDEMSDLFGISKGSAKGQAIFREELEKTLDVANLSRTELQRLVDSGLDYFQSSLQLTAEEAEFLAGILQDRLNKQLGDLENQAADRVLTGLLNPALVETKETAEEAAARMEEAAEAAGQIQKEADEAAEANRALRDSFLALADPIFAANDAMGRLRDAQENLIEVQDDVDSSAEDVADAQLAVAESALIAQGALEDLGDGDLAGGIARIAEALGISDDEARELLETLGLLDGKKVETVVNTRYTTSGKPPPNVVTNQTGTYTPRARGGPVTDGTPYLVGERGPELFVPNNSGQILPNSALAQMGSVSSSRNFDLTINYPQTTGNDVFDGVRRGLELNGLIGIAENTP